MTTTAENLGPAERIIQMLLNYADHMVHNRPGAVVKDATSPVGVRWSPVTHKIEAAGTVVYRLDKRGNKETKVRLGIVPGGLANSAASASIMENGREVAEYRAAGIFPEVVAWMYQQVAEVWKLDNEFAARWASFAFGQEHRDLKVVLAAFMLVQSRKGDPVVDGGKVAFHDEDYRAVGEAMMLLTRKDKNDFSPKLLLRVREVLEVPAVAQLNHKLGFGQSERRAFLGRWPMAVQQWLRYRSENPKMLEGLVKAGFTKTVRRLASEARFKPDGARFCSLLRWKQRQAADGHRKVALDMTLEKAETWQGLTERQICERIVRDKVNFKRAVGMLPEGQGVTRAIVAAAIEAGMLSDKDLVIYTPTLEELGLLEVQDIKERWERAVKAAEDMRAANIATRVKSKATAEKLQAGADAAVKKAVEEVSKDLRVYVFVDISSSQQEAIERSKSYIARFLQGFPAERLHVATFNTAGREVKIQHASAAGVTNAFRGIVASGGTNHAAGVNALAHHKPKDDEDVVCLFFGDEEDNATFDATITRIGLRPMAFGLCRVIGPHSSGSGACVQVTAARLHIPCFLIDEKTFDDPYAIPRTVRALVASTPVGVLQQQQQVRAPRQTLVEQILKQPLLQKPAWAG